MLLKYRHMQKRKTHKQTNDYDLMCTADCSSLLMAWNTCKIIIHMSWQFYSHQSVPTERSNGHYSALMVTPECSTGHSTTSSALLRNALMHQCAHQPAHFPITELISTLSLKFLKIRIVITCIEKYVLLLKLNKCESTCTCFCWATKSILCTRQKIWASGENSSENRNEVMNF